MKPTYIRARSDVVDEPRNDNKAENGLHCCLRSKSEILVDILSLHRSMLGSTTHLNSVKGGSSTDHRVPPLDGGVSLR